MPMPKTDDHFESLFEFAPISLWEEDYSGIKDILIKLRSGGVSDIEEYLDAHPDLVDESLRSIEVTRVNRETLDMFGAKSEQELLSNIDKIFRDEMRDHWRSELAALWNGDMHWSGEGINYRLDGEPLNIRLHWRVLPECEANWECVLVSIENITAQKKAEERYHRLFEYAPISLWEEDYSALKQEFDHLREEGVEDLRLHLARNPEMVRRFMGMIHVRDVNRRTLEMFEAADKETLLANLDKVFRGQMSDHFLNELVDMWNGKTHYEREGINYSMSGEPINVHLNWTLMPGHEQDFKWVLVALQDVTARKKTEDYLRYLGTHDVMTSLYNRAYFEETLKKLETSRRDPVSFIVADLNGLKVTNDTLGHHAGDQLIRRAAEVLKASLDDGYLAARIGGDEFVIILTDSDEEAVEKLVERIRSLTLVNNKFYREPELSFSVGFATSSPGISLEKTVNLADDAMYQDKGRFYRRRKDDD